MTDIGWLFLCVSVLALIVAALALVVAQAFREIDHLRDRIDRHDAGLKDEQRGFRRGTW